MLFPEFDINYVTVLGLDVSVTHAGWNIIRNGEFIDGGCFEARKQKTKTVDGQKYKLYPDDEEFIILRKHDHIDNLESVISKYHPDFVSMEGYAFAGSGSVFQIAEITGAYKSFIYDRNLPLRIYDPNTIKFFFSGKGNAKKEDMIAASDIDFCKILFPKTSKLTKEQMERVGDATDAYAIAKIMHMELLLRKGVRALHELNSQEILAFNRVTKAYPVNILSRSITWKGHRCE